ncbi:MAG: hypothetical protein R3E53_17315 [Myxococcota bacterium]
MDGEAAVLGDGGRDEVMGLGDARRDESVDLARLDARVLEGEAGELGPLLEHEARLRRRLALGLPVRDAHDRGVSLHAHVVRPLPGFAARA